MPDQDPVNFTYIAHSDHTTVNKAVTQIIPEYCSSTSANENHKDQMETVADWYEKPNKLYVETNAFRESKNILENQYWVTIIGKPGDGKSMMAAHLMSQYRHKGFEPVFITSVQDWKNLITGDRVKQFVVIDDLFGTTCLDRVKLKEWEAYIGIIEKLVSKRKGNLLVVSTSRKYIFEDAKTSLAKFELFRNFKLLDLTSDSWKLTIKEKEEIFEKYAVKYKIEDYSRQDVGQLDTPHGYPHCVAMFCTNIFFRKAGLTFFKNPAQCIQKEIHNFRVNDRIKYLVLLLGLKTELKEHAIETLCYEPTETTKHLFKAAGVSLDTALPDICIALYSLTNTYLRKGVDGCFYFTHESLLENVAAVFMSVSPILAIKTVDFRLLFMKKYTGTSVLSFNAHTSDHSVSAHEEVLRQMIRRITTELFQRNVFHVIMCDVWNDQKFVNHWVKYVSTMKADKLVELFCPKTNVFGNLFTTFIQLNKGYVLKTVLDNRFLCGKIDLLHLLQECLEVGCSENCSSNLVKAIVTHPVASPNKLNGSKLLMEALEKSNFICAKLLLENTVIDQKYVDNFERGYFHRLVRTQVKLEDIDIFETILKALLNICDDINTKDCLDESPMDFFINNVDKMLIADEKGSAYFICACLARNDFKPLNKISTYLHSYISQKIQSRSMSDSQTFENIIKDVFNDFPDLLEYIFYYPYPAAVAFMDHHHVGLFEALNLYTFQSLFNEIIRHQKLEHVFITSLKHKSVHMKSSSSWAKFLQRGLERVCFETFSYLKRIKTLATVLSGDIKAETIELFCSKINELGKSFTTFIQLNKGCVVQSILDKLALPGLLQECLEIACAVICSTELVKTIVLHPIASSNRLEGSESLMKALEKSNFTCANLLIDNTAIDQQYVDNFERGYLHRLVRAQIKCGDLDIFETVLKAILDIGCDINTKDSFGDSPLDYMIIDGKYESAFRICSCLMRKRFIPMKQRIYTLTFPKYYKEGHGVKLKLLKR